MLPEEARSNYMTDDGSVAVIRLTVLHVDNEKKEDLYDALKDIISSPPPGVKASITGMQVMLLQASKADYPQIPVNVAVPGPDSKPRAWRAPWLPPPCRHQASFIHGISISKKRQNDTP